MPCSTPARCERADGGIDIDRIRAFIESKLHLVPRYRQRLAYVPFERHPVWVDDEHFQIDYHVRHSSLPKPGSFDQLTELTARLVSQQLDRSKPLWELSVIEGLEGDRFAFVTKIHHSMIDGISGAELLAILLNLTPVEDDPRSGAVAGPSGAVRHRVPGARVDAPGRPGHGERPQRAQLQGQRTAAGVPDGTSRPGGRLLAGLGVAVAGDEDPAQRQGRTEPPVRHDGE